MTPAGSRPVVHLIPHTHWDREWYLSRGAFQARLVAALSDVLDRLDADEALRFLLDGQTIVAEDYLDLCPEDRARVERLAVTGRLQLGPWYVLADQLIPSGEALIRNLLAGAASARALGADPMPVAYSPDAFGHPAALPTIAAEFGIRHAVVWRGVDVTRNVKESDLFRWSAPNGATLLAYHLPRAGYEIGVGLSVRPASLEREWAPMRSELLKRACSRHIALFAGADHHAMRPDLMALRDALAAVDPGCEFRISSLMEFFRGVDREAPSPPALRGELRRSPEHTWSLQGVHATRAPIKRANAALELLLQRDVEPLLAQAPGTKEHRAALLGGAWRLALQNQFHDSLAGTIADEAARDVAGRFVRARQLACRAAADAVDDLAGHDADRRNGGPPPTPMVVVWNPAPRARSAVVIADLVFPGTRIPVGPPAPAPVDEVQPAPPDAFVLASDGGESFDVQVLHTRWTNHMSESRRHYPLLRTAVVARVAFRTPVLPGCSLTSLRLVPKTQRGEGDGDGVTHHPGRLANRLVSLSLGDDGSFTMEDRVRGRTFPRLLGIRHERDRGDAYTVHRAAGDLGLVRVGAVARSGAGGSLLGWLRGEYRLRGRGESIAVSVLAVLYVDSPVVRWSIVLDNRARDHRLIADFPLGLPGTLRVGAPFGVLERGPEAPGPPAGLEDPPPTAPAHRYVARLASGSGVALFQPGFFEYQWNREGNLALTVLRAIGRLSRGDLPERPGHAAWPTSIPDAQCLGRHEIRIAAAPIGDDSLEPGRLQRLWEDAVVPPWARWLEGSTREVGPTPSRFGSITLEGAGLCHSACKPAASGEGVALRCWNEGETGVRGAWRFERPVRQAILCRADERPVDSLTLEDGGRVVAFPAAARAPVTVIVT